MASFIYQYFLFYCSNATKSKRKAKKERKDRLRQNENPDNYIVERNIKTNGALLQ